MKRVDPRIAAAVIVVLAAVAAWATSRISRASPQTPQASVSTAQPAATAAAAASGATAVGGVSPASTAGQGGPDGVAPTPIPGIVEVRRGAEIVYMTRDGKYVITGDLYQVASHNNLTEARRRALRRGLIDAVPESQMVVFSPPRPAYTVTVFTDVDCQYCRAFHRQIADYNRLGVRVRYVFFPRTGPNTESWYKAEQVWCSADRRQALTRAKLGERLDAKLCASTPVAREYELGKAIGLEGTPGIVAADGAMLGGYMPPDALLEALKQEPNNTN